MGNKLSLYDRDSQVYTTVLLLWRLTLRTFANSLVPQDLLDFPLSKPLVSQALYVMRNLSSTAGGGMPSSADASVCAAACPLVRVLPGLEEGVGSSFRLLQSLVVGVTFPNVDDVDIHRRTSDTVR